MAQEKKNVLPIFLPHKEHHIHHPGYLWWVATFVLLALIVIFGFISVFVPWAMKDIAPGQRAWAFPFKTCVEDTFSDVNQETCLDNDFIEPNGVKLTGDNHVCEGYILATIAWVFISVLLGVITLILIGYILEHLWWSPFKTALVVDFLLVIIFCATFLAWIMFVVYAGLTCAPDSIFPVHGYSYGFILYLFASAFAIGMMVTAYYGTIGIKRFRDMERAHKEAMEMMYQEPPVEQAVYTFIVPTPSTTSPSPLLYPAPYPPVPAAGTRYPTAFM